MNVKFHSNFNLNILLKIEGIYVKNFREKSIIFGKKAYTPLGKVTPTLLSTFSSQFLIQISS